MNYRATALALITLGFIASNATYAASCTAPKAPKDLSTEEMQAVYDCLHPKLVEGYAKKGNTFGTAYSGWKAASTLPGAPGVHSGQHLMTYVNDVGYDQYVEFRTDKSEMPVGTVIAKENFEIKDSGKIKIGALLLMEKVGIDQAPETAGWRYSGVKKNGKNLKVDEKGFCHACHQAYPHQDYQGYPILDKRVSSN